jgi:DNA repair protein RecN (Recombination protein N)
MLASLSIRDFVLIEKLDLDFSRSGGGLGALTGETGAGKSILIDALSLALGARAESGAVRRGAAQASVSASFDLPSDHPAHAVLGEQGFETEDVLTLRRMIGADGRGRAFVNDQPASVALLRRLGETLVEIQGWRPPGRPGAPPTSLMRTRWRPPRRRGATRISCVMP